MEIWIAPTITGILAGIAIMFGNRILTRLDKIDARFDKTDSEIFGMRLELGEIKTEQAVQKVQLQMVLDYFMPEKKNRIGE